MGKAGDKIIQHDFNNAKNEVCKKTDRMKNEGTYILLNSFPGLMSLLG